MIPDYPPDKLYLLLARNLQTLLTTKAKIFGREFQIMQTMKLARSINMLCFYVPQLSFCVDYEDKMAKSKGNFNLIDYRLSETELDAFEAWAKQKPPSFASMMAELATMNYKLSLTFVENSESWCASITGKEDAKFNSGATITTWGDDVEEAILMAFFKVVVIFEKGKWVGKAKSNRG